MDKVIYDKMVDEILIPCDCGCSILQATRFTDEPIDDQAVYLCHYYSSFSGESVGFLRKLADRIKGALFILIGKRYLLYEIVMNGEDKARFIEFVKGLEE